MINTMLGFPEKILHLGIQDQEKNLWISSNVTTFIMSLSAYILRLLASWVQSFSKTFNTEWSAKQMWFFSEVWTPLLSQKGLPELATKSPDWGRFLMLHFDVTEPCLLARVRATVLHSPLEGYLLTYQHSLSYPPIAIFFHHNFNLFFSSDLWSSALLE